jgi:type VI secretion system secreted protein Hcp
MKRLFLLTLMAPLVAASSLYSAQVDFFLHIEGIDGESSDDKHKDQIEILSFSWGVSNPASAGGGGGGQGKVAFQDLSCVCALGKASPQLFLACARTNPIPSATLFLRKPDTREEYMKIELQDCLVSSYSVSGHGGASSTGDLVPTDQFSLNFASVKMTYTGTNGTGSTGIVVRVPPQ